MLHQREYPSDKEILKKIQLLSRSFGGVRPPCDPQEMRLFFEGRNFAESIRGIKRAFSLPMTLRIGYLRENLVAREIFGDETVFGPRFICPDIPANELLRGSHCEPAKEPAFIHVPNFMPLLGNRSFEGITITMYLRRWLLTAPFESFAFAVSHQMAHIVLHATHHHLRYSEIATDLMAMVSGFSEIARIGRKFQGQRLGYLDDHQFCLAYQEISRLC